MEMVEDFETYSSLADVGELRLHCTGFTSFPQVSRVVMTSTNLDSVWIAFI